MDAAIIYEPDKWHTCRGHAWQACTLAANCYAYALNRPDYYWAVPGEGFAKTEVQHYFKSYNVYFEGVSRAEMRERLVAGALRDGLIAIDEPAAPRGFYPVVLFLSDHDLDFHWYRRDDNGTWSHKNGWRPVSDKDTRGESIEDLSRNPDPDYPILGGFFLVPRQGIKLRQSFLLVPPAS